jgi:hypothetical protein
MLIRRLKTLQFRHGLIQEQIDAEQSAPRPDAIRLIRLKRLKLALKDRMRRIARALEMQNAPPRLSMVRAADLRRAP